VAPTPWASLSTLYAAFFAAQLALVGIGLPVSVAILLRNPNREPDTLARILGTWRWRLTIGLPIALMLFVAPLPAAWGLVSVASAPERRWRVDGWVVYVTAIATSLALLWLVVAIARASTETRASVAPSAPTAPVIVASPPRGIGFVWEQGVRVIGQQLDTADGLDRKIAPLVAATIATAAIVAAQKDVLRDFTGLLMLELGVTAIYLVLALVVRTFQTVPRLAIIAPYAAASAAQLQLAFLGNLLQVSARNDEALSGKTVLLNAAIATLFVFFTTGFFAIQRLAN
jgi:hypothetical protein